MAIFSSEYVKAYFWVSAKKLWVNTKERSSEFEFLLKKYSNGAAALKSPYKL
jgi:hypothetical protein